MLIFDYVICGWTAFVSAPVRSARWKGLCDSQSAIYCHLSLNGMVVPQQQRAELACKTI